MRRGELLEALDSGALTNRLAQVYGADARSAADRLGELMREFESTFPCGAEADTWLFSAPGRAELGGSHTDHQRGHGLAAAVDLDTIACVVPNDSGTIRIKSRNHRMAIVDLEDLDIHEPETGTSMGLVRGVAARLHQLGYQVGGFDAYTTTRVLRGSGLSSSAAFEVLTASIMNHLFCGGALTPLQVARTAQYAENVYFQKPSGPLDQLSCALGGVVAVDFRDPEAPALRRFPLDLTAHGYAFCVLDSRASHADLVADFAAIPREMGQVAACFGRDALRDVPPEEFFAKLPQVREQCGDRAALRAYHFFQEERRVLRQCEALDRGDLPAFLHCVRQSGQSSYLYLQNASNYKDTRFQPLGVLQALAEELLDGQGAVRIQGGGFAGTVEAFVPLDRLEMFTRGIEAAAGPGCCHTVAFRSTGAALLVK